MPVHPIENYYIGRLDVRNGAPKLLKKRALFGKNRLKDQFHIKTGLIFLFYCRTVSLKTDK